MNGARLTVDLAAIRKNYQTYVAINGSVASVVKANAYGLGVDPIAETLWQAGCREFFVATVREAVELRGLLAEATIYALSGPITTDDIGLLNKAAVVPVINHESQIELCRGSIVDLAIHVDTGINRLGFRDADAAADAARGFNVVVALSHFACADEPDNAANVAQRKNFERVRALFPNARPSFANSAAARTASPGLARVGLGLWGASPFADDSAALEPVVVFEVPVIATYQLAAGEAVGYGATYVARRDERVGVIAAGYADGVRRALSNHGRFVWRGHDLAIRGRISMDLTVVDLPAGVELETGDAVEWFGREQSLESVARDADVVNYEILTGIGARVERVYVNG